MSSVCCTSTKDVPYMSLLFKRPSSIFYVLLVSLRNKKGRSTRRRILVPIPCCTQITCAGRLGTYFLDFLEILVVNMFEVSPLPSCVDLGDWFKQCVCVCISRNAMFCIRAFVVETEEDSGLGHARGGVFEGRTPNAESF